MFSDRMKAKLEEGLGPDWEERVEVSDTMFGEDLAPYKIIYVDNKEKARFNPESIDELRAFHGQDGVEAWNDSVLPYLLGNPEELAGGVPEPPE